MHPEAWNGDLVVYAHGLGPATSTSPATSTDPEKLAALVGHMGYAFASVSYTTGSISTAFDADEAIELIGQAIATTELLPTPNRIFLAGISTGGVIVTHAAERFPAYFDGALAACSPTGSLIDQVNYTGDFRVLFDYFYPGVIPGSVVDIPQDVILAWETGELQDAVRQAVRANPDGARQMLDILKAQVDRTNTAILEEAIIEGLNNGLTPTTQTLLQLAGQPFDNNPRRYKGSFDDVTLNRSVGRFDANVDILAAITSIETTGDLQIPYVSMHTTGDVMVPVSQQRTYKTKVRRAGASLMYSALPVKQFGHCTFQESDFLASFAYLVLRATGELPYGAAQLIMADPGAYDSFVRLSRERKLSLEGIAL